jgi:GNAT superfamily N-acetyltransferase
LIGTITLTFPVPAIWTSPENWYGRPGVAIAGPFAVDPDHQKQGFGTQLMKVVERHAARLGVVELAVDTSEGAAHLLRFYEKRSYRRVGLIEHEGKTYRSVILSKSLPAASGTAAG